MPTAIATAMRRSPENREMRIVVQAYQNSQGKYYLSSFSSSVSTQRLKPLQLQSRQPQRGQCLLQEDEMPSAAGGRRKAFDLAAIVKKGIRGMGTEQGGQQCQGFVQGMRSSLEQHHIHADTHPNSYRH
ncbi:MAG: hypothetical protein Greene101449_652 [Candidatus Peregrinibacteria bacterium Greene1014_49]|nr:MAG: hypothetical protein Greene101449_652 [Candidatus Peregrinibacteria bacterium Greene1014_49]